MIPVLPKIFWSVAILSVVTPAFAQYGRLSADYDCVVTGARAARHEAELAMAKRKEAQKAEAAGPGKIHETLLGMRSAVGVGETIADYLERHPNISIEFHAIEGISAHDEIGGSVPLITLRINKDLPRTPRVLAVAIAKEASEMMLRDMPESAEKAYMQHSMIARSWIELGGSKSALPELEHLVPEFRNAEMEALIRAWVGKAENTAIWEIGQAKGLRSLDDMVYDVETEMRRLVRFVEQDREHEYRTHHPDPDVQPQVKRYYELEARLKQLQLGQKMYEEFVSGVNYTNVQGEAGNNKKGERLWRQMNKAIYDF